MIDTVARVKTKDKKQVVSFALEPEVKKELLKHEKHTVFVAAVVTAALGRCPSCGGPWPHKPAAESKEGDGSN
jgi:hypothetical protein